MARPTKDGLDYFSFDARFLSNRKIRRIMRDCGASSPTVLICLLCNIYAHKGYYIKWDDELPFDIADQVGVKESVVREVVAKALEVSFFNADKFKKYKILTSVGIQERFVEGTRKRKKITIEPSYWMDGVEKPHCLSGSQTKAADKTKISGTICLIDTQPPHDGIPRNWDAVRRFLHKYNICTSEANEIIRLSNYGQVSSPPEPVSPFWKLKREVEESNGKIKMPGAFILSRMKPKKANILNN